MFVDPLPGGVRNNLKYIMCRILQMLEIVYRLSAETEFSNNG